MSGKTSSHVWTLFLAAAVVLLYSTFTPRSEYFIYILILLIAFTWLNQVYLNKTSGEEMINAIDI